HRHVLDRLDDAIEHRLTGLRVNDLTAAEDDHKLALVAFLQEAADVFDLEVEIVVVRLGTQLDLLEDDRRLVPTRGLLLRGGLVLDLAEVHDLADRRRRPRIDFDQLQPLLFSEAERLMGLEDADLRPVGADDARLGHSDTAADSIVVRRARGWGVIWPWDVLSPWFRVLMLV